jgi:valyl-tRNA synthetase
VARLARVQWIPADPAPATDTPAGEPVATVPVPGGVVSVFASDAVDLEAQARRAQARLAELESEIARAEGKLANERFVAKAPEQVVAAEREKLERLRAELEDLR